MLSITNFHQLIAIIQVNPNFMINKNKSLLLNFLIISILYKL
jgi:hypothetical protein